MTYQKNSLKRIIAVLLCVILSLSLFSCKIFDNGATKEPTGEAESASEPSFIDVLEEQVESGAVSKDTYISTTLLGVFDADFIPKEYQDEEIVISDIRPYIEEAETYWDELSDQTKTAIAEALTLSFIEFDTGEKKTGASERLFDGLMEEAYALTDNVLINDVLQSGSGRFNIWFNDGDPNSATKAEAQIVADALDEAADLYDAYFNTTFRYVREALYRGATTSAQEYILMANGYQAADLLNCMNVYLCDYTDSDAKAACFSGIRGFLEKLVIPFIPDSKLDTHGIATFPYIIIDSDQPFDGLMKEVVYHELFHYYQNDILGNDIAQCDLLGMEATANWAAAMNVPIDDSTIDFSMWSSAWQQDCDNWFQKNSKTRWGYGLYKALYHYQENVRDGTQKIVDALFEPDFLSYLESSSSVEERNAMMKDLAYHGFANDYENPALVAKRQHSSTINLSKNSAVNNAVAPKLSVKYYQINAGETENPAVHFVSSREEITGTLFVKYKDGTYARISSSASTDETLKLPQDEDVSAFFMAVSNASFSEGGSYSLAVVKGETPASSIAIEKTVLMDDEKLKIVAESANLRKNIIYLTCSYENKTANELALKASHCVINGYVFNSYIEDYHAKYRPIEPNGKGTFTIRLYALIAGDSFDLNQILKCNAIGEIGVTFPIGHFKDDGKGTIDYTVGPCYIKTADYGREGMPSSVLQSYGQSESQLGLSKLLTYQPINRKLGDVMILGVAVYQMEDGSHTILAEAENIGNSSKSIVFDIEKVNGCEFSCINEIDTEAGCRALESTHVYEISASERMTMYGLSSIGSYTVRFRLGRTGSDREEGFEVTLSFGEESPVSEKQNLIKNKLFTFSYIGSGMRMISNVSYKKDTEVVFWMDKHSDDFICFVDLSDEVLVDGEAVNGRWVYGDRDNGYVILRLEDVDPNQSHTVSFTVTYDDWDEEGVRLETKVQKVQITTK